MIMMLDSVNKKRAIIIVLDSLGMGENPDASLFGDVGANTLGHIAERICLHLPNLASLGLGNIMPLDNIPPAEKPKAAYGRMIARSSGKDTTSGHWEIAGIVLDQAFPVFPKGFPMEIIEPFCRAVGRGVLGNCVASGTQIIADLGEEHLRTGDLIVYTSADSVFQIAAHEEIVPLPELYDICHKARKLLQGKFNVGRVIARPFIGSPGNFIRTENRRDFSVVPPENNLLQKMVSANIPVISIGKISDIFAGKGITTKIEAHNNRESIEGLIQAVNDYDEGLIFVNLVDFDTLYGHRNDVVGYAAALTDFDICLSQILSVLKKDDLLFITSDHGNDPTTPGTDHNREHALLLVYGGKVKPCSLGDRSGFSDLGATCAEYFGLEPLINGKSFLNDIL